MTSHASRAVALVLLMCLGPLLAVVPTTTAQTAVFLVFDRDACANPIDCTGVPPNYLQANTVGIRVTSSAALWVRVGCLEGCEGVEGKSFWATWRPERQQLRFPDDFHEGGPNNDGASASALGAPRFNSTWEAAVLVAGREVTRSFHVWTMDVYTTTDAIARPGATYTIHARGFDSSNITVRIDARQATGNWTTVEGPLGLRTFSGVLLHRWEMPRSEAQRVNECHRTGRPEVCGWYRLVISGGGKTTETFTFRVAPAQIEPLPIETTGSLPQTIDRTRNLTAVYQLYYPGGTYMTGGQMLPADLPDSAVNPTRSLRVRVENVTGVNQTYLVAEAQMTYRPERFAWVVEWPVPKDLDLGPTGQARYQLVLHDAQDRWGNRIARTVIGNFTIRAATLAPVLVDDFRVLGRTDEGRVQLRFSYHNGTPWTATDNATRITGCFVPADASTCGAFGAVESVGEFVANGTWSFKAYYNRTFEPLGSYKFLLPQNDDHRDKWGNRLSAYAGTPFELVQGSPRVDFKTILRGLDTDTLERGHRVSVQATVTYGDGKAFNHTHAPGGSYFLPVTLVKRAASGEIVSEEPFTMRQTDAATGRFLGTLELTREEASTPLGNWTFRIDVRDNLSTPNYNVTEFTRSIVSAPISLDPLREPPGAASTGSRVTFRFTLRYEDGSAVAPENIGQRLEARVYRYDGQRIVGEPISGRLNIVNDAGVYSLEYTVPPRLFTGQYVFSVTGGDRFGNLLAQGALSKPFVTFAEPVPRGVLTQPAESIRRGESGAVVFDGDAGDMSLDTRGLPVIRAERFDPTRGEWVVEAASVRDASVTNGDHVGIFQVDERSTVGIYRFVLEGRDLDYRPFTATSRNFTVLPTEITRALVGTPLRTAVKGEGLEIEVERRDGDQYRDVQVLYNGRVVQLQPPVLGTGVGTTKIIWNVPFEAPAGNYSFILRGFDLYGNTLVVRTPTIEAQSAALTGRILGNPARTVTRGETVTILFGIQYPTGAYYVAADTPTANVLDADGRVLGAATVKRSGLTYEATWSPPPSTPVGEYVFEISGRGTSGNVFPTLRSDPFRIGEGSFGRGVTSDVSSAGYERGDTPEFAVARNEGDTDIRFTLEYFGQVLDLDQARQRGPISASDIPHDEDPLTGRYVARLPTDTRTPVGAYRFRMEGTDASGNAIQTESAIFLLRTTPILVRPDGFPPQSAFVPGGRLEFSFALAYRNGRTMDDTGGRPSAAILLNGQPITTRPEIQYQNNRWHVSWDIPLSLIDGTYTITVGGADSAGNTIVTGSTTPYVYKTDTSDSFAQVIPGPSPLLVALALAGLAGVVGAAKRRRSG